ncbi:MAG TPA: tetratricopeptide repeat protein [Puia sp.]|jgi:signal transduction histidine kinase
MYWKVVMTGVLLIFVGLVKAQSPLADSLRRIIELDRRDSVQAHAHIMLADALSRSDLPAAKKQALQGLSIARQLNLPLQLSAAYSELTTLHMETREPDSARYYLDLLKELADGSSVTRIAINYNQTAGLFYHKQGNEKASLPFLLEGLRLSTLDGSKIGMAGQSLNAGNCYVSLGDYKNAMLHHLRALELFEALGNKRGISYSLTGVGGDFIQLNQFADALPYIQRALALKNELNDTRGKATAYSNMGDIASGVGDYEKALASYKEALELDKALKLGAEEGKTSFNIGQLYEKMKDVRQAREYLLQAEALFRQSGDTAFLASVHAELANLRNNPSLQESVSNPTEKVFYNTLSTSIRMGDKNAEVRNYRYLSGFYARNGQFDKAFAFNEKYHEAADSLQSRELQLQVRRLEQQYNIEKKEEEITLLKKDRLLYQADLKNRQLFRYGELIVLVSLILSGWLLMARYRTTQKAKRLLEIEKIRNNIARNLHDDIGSAITSINILSKVALKKEKSHILVMRELEKIKDRSSVIMENMGDIVWAINPANDPLEKTILKMKEFAAEILESAGIDFTFRMEGKPGDWRLGVEERKNFYLIFKEAVNNVVKYSCATRAGIVLKREGGRVLLRIEDNGKGFDISRHTNGNGLKNMQGRASEMNALFTIDSSPGAGTVVQVDMPIT